MSMKLLPAMAVNGAAIASRAPPRPPNVLAGPRRDCGPAESPPRRRRGTAGAPIDAAMAHRPRWNCCLRWPLMVPPSLPVPPHVPRTSLRVPAATATPPNRPRAAAAAPPGRRSMPRRRIAQPSLVASGLAARRRRPRIRAGARAHVARRLAKIPVHPLADGGTGRGRRRGRRALRPPAMMTQAFHRSGTSDRANEPIAGRYLGSSHTCSTRIWGHVWPEPG